MRDMRDEMILDRLKELGFPEDEVSTNRDCFVFRNFCLEVNPEALRDERQVYGNGNNYHNYIYPEGLIPNLDKITIKKHTSGPFTNRINTISIPLTAIKSQNFSPEEFVQNINLTYTTNHIVCVSGSPAQMELTVDYSSKRGEAPADELLKGLLAELQPRIPYKDDIKGPNYISHLGRLAHMLNVSTMNQAIYRLRGSRNQNEYLLDLHDQIVSSPSSSTTLYIHKSVFRDWLEKAAREEQLLSKIVVANLNMEATNWVAADLNQLKNPGQQSPRLRQALATKDNQDTAPLYLSTTTGQHAFAMMIDFKNKTVFLANPLGTYDNFEEIVAQVKRISGCHTVKYVNTQPLKREGDIPFQDVCTADSVVLAHMMQTYYETYGALEADCFNGQKLETAKYVTRHVQDVCSKPRHASLLGVRPEPQLESSYPHNSAQFLKQLKSLYDNMSDEAMSAHEQWSQATRLLEKQEDYVPEPESGSRSVEYTADLGDRCIKKTVSEEAQIMLDRLYANKLATMRILRIDHPSRVVAIPNLAMP